MDRDTGALAVASAIGRTDEFGRWVHTLPPDRSPSARAEERPTVDASAYCVEWAPAHRRESAGSPP